MGRLRPGQASRGARLETPHRAALVGENGVVILPLPREREGGSMAERAFSSRVSILRESDKMLRTQVSLEEQDYRAAKREAPALGISVAEYVRRAIRNALPVPRLRGQPKWMRYAGLVESGNPQSSQSIDEIVYGDKE